MKRVTIFCRSIAIFCCICGKKEQHKRHSRKKAKQKTNREPNQKKRKKERERAGHLHEGERLRMAEHQADRARTRAPNSGILQRRNADKSKFWQREEPVRLFWTFQARVGERRCRSCTRSRTRRAKTTRRKRAKPPSKSDDRDFCLSSSYELRGRYRPLLRSGSGSVFARGKIYTISIMQYRARDRARTANREKV